jgi:sortase A
MAALTWFAGISLLVGAAISGYALFGIRQPLPEQAEPVTNPVSCAGPTREVGDTPASEQQAAPTISSEVVSYTKSYAIGDELGTITIPVLGLSWPIFQGTGEEQLALGVGHYVGSVLPGLQDNTILSGHRTSVFNRIGELEVNDLILIQTEPGIFTYQVRGSRVVDRDDQTVIGPTPTAVLTLTTCYPFNSLTRTTQAFLVEADLIRTVLVE